MFSEILATLENHFFGMGLVFILWVILFDQKAIDRVNKPKIKKSIYIAIIIYYVLILFEIIQLFRNM